MERVLIVDDSKAARMMLKHWVQALRPGCEVLEAGNADEAVGVVDQLEGDAIAIIDYNMPGENGVALAERLSAHLPVARMFLVTANIQEAVRKKAAALGMGYMAKPLNPQKVSAILSSLEPSG